MTWNNMHAGQGLALGATTPVRVRWMGLALIAIACLLILGKLVVVVDRNVPLPIPGRHPCPPRIVEYCVVPWPRDPWNIRSRWAIGLAARRLNATTRFRLKEVLCTPSTYLPIFFVSREAHDAWHAGAPYGDAIAHTTFPGWQDQHVHVNDSLAFMQASDTLWRGYDLETILMHEFGHVLGLDHDPHSWGTLMRPYRRQHLPGQLDENQLHAIENRCLDADEHDPIEVLAPGPGETWRQGSTYRVSWRSELPPPLHVGIYREGRIVWAINDNAESSGSIDIPTNIGWPLGPAMQACVASTDWSTTACSDMFLVAPP